MLLGQTPFFLFLIFLIFFFGGGAILLAGRVKGRWYASNEEDFN